MADPNTTLTPALRRALGLLANPPSEPDASTGHLDLLGPPSVDSTELSKDTGPMQAMWASPLVAMIYDNKDLGPLQWLRARR